MPPFIRVCCNRGSTSRRRVDHEGERRTMSIVTGEVLYILVSIQVNGREKSGKRGLHKVSTFNDKEIG